MAYQPTFSGHAILPPQCRDTGSHTQPNVLNPGPVVQSIVSLTSSLRGQLIKCFNTL